MRFRIRQILTICCFALSAISIEATGTDTTEETQVHVAQTDERAGDGFFSSILSLFRSWNTDADSDSGSEAVPEQEVVQPEREVVQPPQEVVQPKPEDEGSDITLSHVYQSTLDLIAEIRVLREAKGIENLSAGMGFQEDRAPIHAYAKSLEVMGKAARVQRRYGMIPVEVQSIPVKNITPSDVYGSVQAVIEELRRVKRQLVIKAVIVPAPFAGGKTPSLVYGNLIHASELLDALIGRPVSSNDVYKCMLHVRDEMALIADKLGIALETDAPAVEGARENKDVAQQIMRATYKTINLQSRLGMDASRTPNSILDLVTPAEVFDAANILLAELVRIKAHLDIGLQPASHHESRNKQPADVFAQALLIIENLNIMTRAADSSG